MCEKFGSDFDRSRSMQPDLSGDEAHKNSAPTLKARKAEDLWFSKFRLPTQLTRKGTSKRNHFPPSTLSRCFCVAPCARQVLNLWGRLLPDREFLRLSRLRHILTFSTSTRFTCVYVSVGRSPSNRTTLVVVSCSHHH